MAEYYNTPHTQWVNQPKSYWIPVRYVAYVLAYIRSIMLKAKMKIGNKWSTANATSERVN